MTKFEICEEHAIIAHANLFGGLEVRFVEYGTDDYLYIISGVCSGKRKYHRVKVKYTKNSSYVVLYGQRCKLSEFLRV